MPPRDTPSTAILSASPVSIPYSSWTNLPFSSRLSKAASYTVIGRSCVEFSGLKRRKIGVSIRMENYNSAKSMILTYLSV